MIAVLFTVLLLGALAAGIGCADAAQASAPHDPTRFDADEWADPDAPD